MKIFYFIELPGNCAPLRLSMQKCYNSFELRYIIEESATERHFVFGFVCMTFQHKIFSKLETAISKGLRKKCKHAINLGET